MNKKVEIEVSVDANIDWIWECWNDPKHIVHWSFADESWHAPTASVDLREKGLFSTRMEAKDGSDGFDFSGEYQSIEENKQIIYKLEDGRRVWVNFVKNDDNTVTVKETFELEDESSAELQKHGWQMILENFKKYVENQK